jgi:hypothetical protein
MRVLEPLQIRRSGVGGGERAPLDISNYVCPRRLVEPPGFDTGLP